MISKGIELIQAKEFNIGLYTASDIVNANPNLSPNCMDIQWFFDKSIGKRLGSSTQNTTALANATSSGFTGGFGTLTNGLLAYWNMNEASGTRMDLAGTNNLVSFNNVLSAGGIISGAASYVVANSQVLQVNSSTSLELRGGNFTYAFWVFKTDTRGALITRQDLSGPAWEVTDQSDIPNKAFQFLVYDSGGANSNIEFFVSGANSMSLNTWYNVVVWYSGGSHIGGSINLNASTLSGVVSINQTTGSPNALLSIGGLGANTGGGARGGGVWTGRFDEVGYWNRVLTATERSNLYNSGTGTTYISGALGFGWASFDFGAGLNRWYTVCAGTGIFASSDLGRTFTVINTGARSQIFQYLERSKNILIATSDAYDIPLYWAGSAGTFMASMAINSAPGAKYSNNYQGFCILLNSQDSNGVISNRRFNYADENLQLTDPWRNRFDLPSSSDDEITGSFVLNKFLYVSTKYLLFRLNYTGGNPDWQYIQVKNFGYVPRTVKVFTLKQGQVAVGLDWNRRIRAFDGYDDQIISDNVENDNDYCEFAMQKISLGGSGLILSHAVFDPNEQEYRLNVSIGANSSNISHAILLNARTLAMYPYSNQHFSTMCIAQSGGQQFVMGVDQAGYAHILNSGNLDIATPINEVYDSPLLFNKAPAMVTKNKQIDFYFNRSSSGTIYYQERFDFSRTFSAMTPLRNYLGAKELTGIENALQIVRTVDLPSVQNVYQYRITSSAGTATPWTLTNTDLFNTPLGFGRGG